MTFVIVQEGNFVSERVYITWKGCLIRSLIYMINKMADITDPCGTILAVNFNALRAANRAALKPVYSHTSDSTRLHLFTTIAHGLQIISLLKPIITLEVLFFLKFMLSSSFTHKTNFRIFCRFIFSKSKLCFTLNIYCF